MSTPKRLIRSSLLSAIFALCFHAQALAFEWPIGTWGASGTVAYSMLSSSGLTAMNSRLGSSTTLKVTEQHGRATVYGGRAVFAAADYPWIAQFSGDFFSQSIANSGVGSRVSSQLSHYNAMGSFEWKLFPSAPMRLKFVKQLRFSRRIYVTAGPLVGLSWATHGYKLSSILDDSDIEYTSQSLLVAGGLQGSFGYAVSRNVHVGFLTRAVWSYPVYSSAEIPKFLLFGQDVRFRGKELGVETLTGTLLTQYSGAAFLTLMF
jgi:hypothetical protein